MLRAGNHQSQPASGNSFCVPYQAKKKVRMKKRKAAMLIKAGASRNTQGNNTLVAGGINQNSFLTEVSPTVDANTVSIPKRRIVDKINIDVSEYSIFHIDSKIRDKLKADISDVSLLYDDLYNLKEIASVNHTDAMQVAMAKQSISRLRNKIRCIENAFQYNYYVLKTERIISEYQRILSLTSQQFIGGVTTAQQQQELNEHKRRYFLIAKEFIEIENYRFAAEKMICNVCKGRDFCTDPHDDTIFLCTNCQIQVEIFDDNPTFKDTDRANMSTKYRYSRRGHFLEAIKKYQGIQNIDPKKLDPVIAIIYKEMDILGLVREQGLPNSVTMDNIYMFLVENRLRKHYDDIYLIHNIITGVPCQDISEYTEKLLEDFDELESVLPNSKDDYLLTDDSENPQGSHALNVFFKLYKLLQKNEAPCRRDNFYFLKTKDKEEEHNDKIRSAFNKLGWRWIPT